MTDLPQDEFEFVKADLEGMEEKDLHDLIERAHQVQQLTHHVGWKFFHDYLTALTATSQHRILLGRCESIEEYRFYTGYVQGMREAIEAPERLLRQVALLQAQADGLSSSDDDDYNPDNP